MIFDLIPAATENPLIFYSSPRTLQEMACSQCALLCWRLTYSHHYNVYPDETADADWFVTCECVINADAVHLPKSIRELIDRHMESIKPMLFRWAINSFGKNCRDNVFNCFGDIVLKQNGEICYKSTAKNLLNGDKLNSVEKYRIACWYGFEEDVQLLWPLVRDDDRVKDCDFNREPTMFYWNCCMREEHDRIPGNERVSPEFRMILSDGLHFWSEVEYFWNRLSPIEQILQIIKIPAGLGFISKNLIPKLSQSQLNHVLKLIPCGMVVNLAIEGETTEYAWQTWNHVKCSISNDQFHEILHRLWNSAFDERWTNVNHVPVFLHEVWISAADNLKCYILNHCVESFFNNLNSDRVIDLYGCDMSFLLDLFANSTIKTRKEIWLANWCKLIILAKSSDLGKFMELCFDNQDCIARFKETVMLDYVMLDYEFDSFVRQGLCDELVDYLKFCTTDEELVQRLRVRIIESNMKNMFYYFDRKAFVKFIDFIDGSFQSLDLAEDFKVNFVLENIHIWYNIIETGCLIDVKSTIECLSSRQQFLIHIKRILFEHWQRILKFGSFNRFHLRECEEFVEWCTSNEEEIALKSSLNVDNILEVLLPKFILNEEILPPYFSPLDSFLRWYFVTEDATKRYKLSRINNYHGDVVRRVLRGGNEEEIRKILYWFFDHDSVAVEKFRTKMIGN